MRTVLDSCFNPYTGQHVYLYAPDMNQPDYTLATADILTAATLAGPEAKKAAVRAVLEAYFPATGEPQPVPAVCRNARQGEIALMIQADGRVEHWEGTTFRVTYGNLREAMEGIDALPRKQT